MKNTITYVIIGILAFLVIGFGYRSLSGNKSNSDSDNQASKVETGTISGTIEYSGIKPQSGENGYVYIEYRDHDTGEFTKLEDVTIPLQDDAAWKVEGVPVDKVYDARAVIKLDSGEIIARSNTITVTAPAQHEIFEFNVTADMIPDYILEQNPVTLGGYVTINGYIPGGSTLSMFAKPAADIDGIMEDVVKNIPVTGSTTDWTWNEAIAGTLYDLRTEAYDKSGALIASSFVGQKAAPSDNAYFVITSRATDPTSATNKTISGTVKVNGNFSENSTVHIKARKTDDSEYKTVTTVSPSNSNTNWTWNEAVSGTEYDVKPFLIEQNKDDITGDKAVTVAPSSSIALKIDTQHKPKTPENKPELTSCNALENNKFTATLKFDNMKDADKYNLQVGKSKGSANVNNSIVNNSADNDPVLAVTINKGQNYYAQYAYTKCEDCDGTGSYSSFSDSLKFKCE